MKNIKKSVMKHIVLISIILWTSNFVTANSWANNANNKPLELGFAFYVGGLHILDAKANLDRKNNKYKFNIYASTRGFTDFIANFVAVTTSEGKVIDNKIIKSYWHTNTSYSNFGSNYSTLKLSDNDAIFVSYPDRNEKNLANLDGNPLAEANDPVATLLNIMLEVKNTNKCSQNLIVIANHFLYKMETSKTGNGNIVSDEYNLSSGKTITCTLDFTRLDKEENLSAYSELSSNGDGKNSPIIIHFKSLYGIPYAIPVMVTSKEERFGVFIMHLQYVKYGDKTYQTPLWNGNKTFNDGRLDILDDVPLHLINRKD